MPIINVATPFALLLPGQRKPGPRIEKGMQDVSEEIANHPYTLKNLVGAAESGIPAPGSPEARAIISAAATSAARLAGEKITAADVARRQPKKVSAKLAGNITAPTRFFGTIKDDVGG